MTPEQLQALKVLANNKAIKESRRDISPGTHPVNFTLHVFGAVKVGEDTSVAPSAKLDDKAIIAWLIQRLDPLYRKVAVSDAVSSLGIMSAAEKKKLVATTDYAETLAREKARALAENGPSPRKGSVSGAIDFDIRVNMAPQPKKAEAPDSLNQDGEFDPIDLLS